MEVKIKQIVNFCANCPFAKYSCSADSYTCELTYDFIHDTTKVPKNCLLKQKDVIVILNKQQ